MSCYVKLALMYNQSSVAVHDRCAVNAVTGYVKLDQGHLCLAHMYIARLEQLTNAHDNFQDTTCAHDVQDDVRRVQLA